MLVELRTIIAHRERWYIQLPTLPSLELKPVVSIIYVLHKKVPAFRVDLAMQLPLSVQTNLQTFHGRIEIVDDRACSQHRVQINKNEAAIGNDTAIPPLRFIRNVGKLSRHQRSTYPTRSLPRQDRWSNEITKKAKPKMPCRKYDDGINKVSCKTIRACRSQPPTEIIIDEALRIVNGNTLNASKYQFLCRKQSRLSS